MLLKDYTIRLLLVLGVDGGIREWFEISVNCVKLCKANAVA